MDTTKTPAVHPLRMSKSLGGVPSEYWHVFDTYGNPVANYLTKENATLIVSLASENARMRAALESTPNPHGGEYHNYRILSMAIVALRDEGHKTLAAELDVIREHQISVLASINT